MEKSGNIIAFETIREMKLNGEWDKISQKLIEENILKPVEELNCEEGNDKLATYLDEPRYEEVAHLWHKKYNEKQFDSHELYREALNEVISHTNIIYFTHGEKILDNYLSAYLQKEKNVSLKPKTIQTIRHMFDTYPEKVINLIIEGKISFNKANNDLSLARALRKDSPLYNMSEEELIIYFREAV